jgi:hypothetical protein
MSATQLRAALVRSVCQYRQIRSFIQTESQTYKTLPLILNPTSILLVQHANGDVQKIVVQGLVIKAGKDWLAPTLTMIAAGT